MGRNKKDAGAVIHSKAGEEKVFPAVVANIGNKQIYVLFEEKRIPCILPGILASKGDPPAVGDEVEISPVGNNQFKLVSVLPRKTALYRGNRRSPGEKILMAANAQYLLAVVTAEYLINQAGYPEAAIIAARRSGLDVGLFISKWDRIGEGARTLLQAKLKLYRDSAGAVFTGTAFEPGEELIRIIKGKTVVVAGDRGCGKSTLINSILEGQKGNNSGLEGQKKNNPGFGNPPSTHTGVLHAGPEETLLIDTPGFRDFSLHGITEQERNSVFPEIARPAEECCFNNCTHTHENGCGVLEAVRSGSIIKERYHAYQEMMESPQGSRERKNLTLKNDYRHSACTESFVCKVCGTLVVPGGAGSRHRNHCPKCLSSVHVDEEPGDRASLCNGIMDPVSVWVRKGGEWAIIHKCRLCGTFSSNRIAADDNPVLLMSIAVKPLSAPPFPLNDLKLL